MTEENIDLAQVTSVETLKAWAYDRVVGIQQLQNELQVINERIAQLQQEEAPVHNGRVTSKAQKA